MSKMSELSQVLDEMIACGEGMIKAANAIKESFSSTDEAPAKPEPVTKDEPTPSYTKEDVRGILAAKSASGFKKEVKELLEKYGAQQLKQLDPKDYAAVIKEAEVIGNA